MYLLLPVSITRVCTSYNYFRLNLVFIECEMMKPGLKKLQEVQSWLIRLEGLEAKKNTLKSNSFDIKQTVFYAHTCMFGLVLREERVVVSRNEISCSPLLGSPKNPYSIPENTEPFYLCFSLDLKFYRFLPMHRHRMVLVELFFFCSKNLHVYLDKKWPNFHFK